MRERNSKGKNNSLHERGRKKAIYTAQIMIGYKEPPVMQIDINARSMAEATTRAIELGRQHIQADILNSNHDDLRKILKHYSEGGELTDEFKESLTMPTVTHDDFDIDGIIVNRADKVQTKVMSEREVNNNLHTGITEFLKENSDKEEE